MCSRSLARRALERLKLDLPTRDNAELFKHETATNRRLRHRNVIKFLRVVIDPPAMAIVIEVRARRAPPRSR